MNPIKILTALLFSVALCAQKPVFTSAKTKSATVFFSGVELAQTTTVNLPAGNSEIVIKNVADNINESTLQFNAPASLTVLSTQFTTNYISEYEIDESNPAIKKVRDSIMYFNKEKLKVFNEKNSHIKTIELLDKNQQVSGVNTGLNVTEFTKLVEYYNTKRTVLSNTINTLQDKEQSIQEKIDRLNKKLEVNTQKEEKASQGKLVLQVMNEIAGNVSLDFLYISNNASWVPFYDLRATSINDPVQLMYKAKVVQYTGIDWKKVKLTLSSGNPNQSNVAPLLSAWFLLYGYPPRDWNQSPMLNQIQSRVAKESEDNLIESVTVAAGQKRKKESTIDDYTTVVENQLNVSFEIDVPYDVLSNGKEHSVSLKELKLPATYKYYSVPKVEKEAFLLAEIADYGKYNLLAGEANIIFEGTNVGKTFINPSQTQDTLNLSMGRDKKISIKREKVADKSGVKFLSSYKEQTFTYDITLRNNKKESVTMLLKDQYPLSTDKDITIELLDDGKAKVNSETGILTWELKLSSNETKKIRISYKVKYPKDKIIGNL
jgi:uncharacterized protein (TIGR02231 family)